MSGIKDFQMATVDAVCKHFSDDVHSNRILVADEVGLGKTIVAKGVISEMLKNKLTEPSMDTREVFKVTYICSNLTLANENKKKLALFRGEDQQKYVAEPKFGRLVELAAVDSRRKSNKDTLLEVNSLTPSTSFNLTSGHGNKWERFIIYKVLIKDKNFSQYDDILSELFRDGVMNEGSNGWEALKPFFDEYFSINIKIYADFMEAIIKPLTSDQLNYEGVVAESLSSLLMNYCRDQDSVSKPVRMRTLLRVELAKACAKNLNADLFILDEFQRFQSLLDTNEENEESLIAREIFKKGDRTKILLLSATPFKALSRIDEDEQNEAHLDELRKLLMFLSDNDKEFINSYEKERDDLLKQILSLRDAEVDIESITSTHKEAVEVLLGSYICRTERAQISDGFDEVFHSKICECKYEFSNDEIKTFKAMDQLAQALYKVHQGSYGSQLIEFYKSAPWALSFLSGYQFKKHLDDHRINPHINRALKHSSEGWVPREQIKNYTLSIAQESPNAKLRAMIDIFFGNKGEELLWVPPTMPYYPHSGSFKDGDTFTKSLLFSSWALVPRALSGLVSYEAERRLVGKKNKRDYFIRTHNPRLRFEGEVSLDVWGLAYPSKSLTDIPLEMGTTDIGKILDERTALFEKKLQKHNHFSEAVDSRYWYALSPMLLDVINGHRDYVFEWLESEFLKFEAAKQKGRYEHLKRLAEELKRVMNYGSYIPLELSSYLAQLSIAGPGVCFARMMYNYWNEENVDFMLISDAVSAVATLFNKEESEMVLKKKYPKEKKYWQMVLNYCLEGNFQAMLDEYAHLLSSSGLALEQAVEKFQDVLGIRPVNVACQFREDRAKKVKNTTLRCHYAVPLGNQKMENDKGVQRVGTVRDAFNSPFRPFVLNSTSIGQEGLDFHWYCSRVIHWNLPSNPIDIEQREGRVNRYKSLVVRRRIKEIYAPVQANTDHDIWKDVFDRADRATKDHRSSDLIPYWHLAEGSAVIERIIPMMPMSREVGRIKEILKVLSLYRLAFGQPRQEELLSNLLERKMSDKEIKGMTNKLVINLAPLMHKNNRMEKS